MGFGPNASLTSPLSVVWVAETNFQVPRRSSLDCATAAGGKGRVAKVMAITQFLIHTSCEKEPVKRSRFLPSRTRRIRIQRVAGRHGLESRHIGHLVHQLKGPQRRCGNRKSRFWANGRQERSRLWKLSLAIFGRVIG